MSCSIICDFWGRHKWDSFISEDWLHHYDSGKDECPECREKRDKASMEAMFAKFRADLGIPPNVPDQRAGKPMPDKQGQSESGSAASGLLGCRCDKCDAPSNCHPDCPHRARE